MHTLGTSVLCTFVVTEGLMAQQQILTRAGKNMEAEYVNISQGGSTAVGGGESRWEKVLAVIYSTAAYL